MELPVDVIQRARHRLIADRRPHGLATDRALQAKARHQPLDGAAGNREAFSPQLPPDLPHAVDAEVLREDPLNLDLQFGVPLRTGRTLADVDPLSGSLRAQMGQPHETLRITVVMTSSLMARSLVVSCSFRPL
jgi:hypothetical protein